MPIEPFVPRAPLALAAIAAMRVTAPDVHQRFVVEPQNRVRSRAVLQTATCSRWAHRSRARHAGRRRSVTTCRVHLHVHGCFLRADAIDLASRSSTLRSADQRSPSGMLNAAPRCSIRLPLASAPAPENPESRSCQ